MIELMEDFFEQYKPYYAEPENRMIDSFVKFAEGRMTKTECENILSQYASDASGECEREGFCE